MAKLITVFWRDIPAQVIGRGGRASGRSAAGGRGGANSANVKIVLEPRFAEAIDRAAMRAGRGSSDKYLEDWRRESRDVTGDLEAEARAEAARLEASFDDARLERIVKAGGVASAATDGGTAG